MLSRAPSRAPSLVLIGVLLSVSGFTKSPEPEEDLNAVETVRKLLVYSARQPHLISGVIKKFEQTYPGVEVEIKNNKGAVLLQQLSLSGELERPDVFITTDASTMGQAQAKGLLLPGSLPPDAEFVKPEWRATDNSWTGITLRARTLAFSNDRLADKTVLNYGKLADDFGRRRLCLRESSSPYNVGFISALIHHYGERQARTLIKKYVENLATDPFASDRSAIRAVASDQCWFTIVNSYYLARLHRSNEVMNVRLLMVPIAPNAGVHVNVSAAAVLKSSTQPELAQQFISFLLSPGAQRIAWELAGEFFVRSDMQQPVIPGTVGAFQPDDTSLEEINKHTDLARKIASDAGYK